MTTYYNGSSEIQGGEGLQTLVLMNQGYVYYPDSQQLSQPPSAGNFIFLDSNHPGNNPKNNHNQQQANMTVAHLDTGAPPSAQTQQFVGIPLSASPPSSVHSQFIPRARYVYSPVEMVAAPREVTPFQQGLSLSLSSDQQSRYVAQATRVPISPTADDGRAGIPNGATGASSGSTSSASRISNKVNGMHNMLLNSKYLKATQELLEEVVNVGKLALNNSNQSTKNPKILSSGGDGESLPPPLRFTREGATAKSGGSPELTTAERQEIQMKKAKLVNILDEVEQRYRQYHHQMQIVISWFEQAAGIRSAKTYTSLALQTISKQFRCLKDAIISQIKAADRSLGEEDCSPGGGMADHGGSRLKFVDTQLRQQRALQQLGMIQHNAWRPQRGLPERSVSVLRTWLFEHFLHPYPKDLDKHMLAKQTGLTRSQVSNWFINARVRLWKPMVEEMYHEEIKQHEQSGKEDDESIKYNENEGNSSSKQGKTESPENSNKGFHPPPAMAAPTSTTATGVRFQHHPSGLIDGITQFSPKKPRTTDGGFTITTSNPTDFISYPMGEIGRFTGDQFHHQYSGNGVSLTLGLPHCENLSISGSHRSFQLRRGAELGEEDDYTAINPSSSSHTAAVYDSMNIQNRKRFAAQPLSDFVA